MYIPEIPNNSLTERIKATPHISHYSNGDIEKLPTRTPGA